MEQRQSLTLSITVNFGHLKLSATTLISLYMYTCVLFVYLQPDNVLNLYACKMGQALFEDNSVFGKHFAC